MALPLGITAGVTVACSSGSVVDGDRCPCSDRRWSPFVALASATSSVGTSTRHARR